MFACAGYNVSPPARLSGGNGDPDAKTTSPFVQLTACSNVHSASGVGFDSGMITGRGFRAAMRLTTASSNAPAIVETPIKAVGLRVEGPHER